MPIVWRYLLRSYFNVLLLCVGAFVSILIVLRFQEIARFAASGAPKMSVLLFTLFQIPYILPLAIPISCLIAGMILFQRLSAAHELTALRTCGLSLKSVLTPLLLAGSLLSIVNFTLANEISPLCRGKAKKMIYEMAASNPLFLLQKESPLKIHNIHYDIGALKANKYAEDVVFAIKNSSNGRLTLMSAKEISLKGEMLKGKQVAFISSVDPKKGSGYDHLVIENQAEMNTKASNLIQFVQTIDWTANEEYLPLKMILARDIAKKGHFNVSRSAQFEIARRLSLGLAAFSFTLIGIAFGMHISRNRSKKGIVWAIALASLFLVCFISARSFRHSPLLPVAILLLPHPIIFLCCFRFIKSVREGVE